MQTFQGVHTLSVPHQSVLWHLAIGIMQMCRQLVITERLGLLFSPHTDRTPAQHSLYIRPADSAVAKSLNPGMSLILKALSFI